MIKIESISFNYEYENAEAAQEALSDLLKQYNPKDFVDGLIVEDNKIKVIFKESFLEKINLTELINKINGATQELQLEDLILAYFK